MKLFLSQKTLEEWALAEKADLQDGKLVLTEGKTTHPVAPAVHFQKLVSGDDTHGLLGRVKTAAQLGLLKAEHYADSCILGDSAYEVVEGYVTEVQGAEPKKKPSSPEADMLAAFILGKL